MVQELIEAGLRHHQAGRLLEAKTLYEQALALQPRHPDALHLLGVVALQSGNAERTVALIEQAIEVQPENPAFHANLAQAHLALQRTAEARAAFRRAAALDPRDPQPAVGAANCLALQGRLAAAERELRNLVRRHPGYALAWFNLGNAVRDQRRTEEAVGLYRRAIQLDPAPVDAHNNLGNALHALGRFDEAEQAFREALALDPGHVLARCNLVSVLIDRGRFPEAEEIGRKIIEDEPRLALAHTFLGAALGHQGRLLEALACYRKASELAPTDPKAHETYAMALGEVGNFSEAHRYFTRALHLNPDSISTHQSFAPLLLAAGQWVEGWRSYGFRPAAERLREEYAQIKLSRELPAVLAGKHVCVLREQGIGDEIFFLRYVRELHLRGARVSYRGSEKIRALLRGADFIHHVLEEHAPIPDADAAILLGDLPQALTASPCSPPPLESPPLPPTLRLTPDEARLEALGRTLRALGSPPYLGVTWRGGIPPAEQTGIAWSLFKEIGLEALADAIRPISGTLISLQRNPRPGEISALSELAGRAVHDLSPLNDDLEDMLALLALIDDYIGVSNTNMHLRACAGKTARVLVPCPAEWRWMVSGKSSPWFPGFKIYRQTSRGDWGAALAELANDLAAND